MFCLGGVNILIPLPIGLLGLTLLIVLKMSVFAVSAAYLVIGCVAILAPILPACITPLGTGIGASISPNNLPPDPSFNLSPRPVPSNHLSVRSMLSCVVQNCVSLSCNPSTKPSHFCPLSALYAPLIP